MVRNTLVPGIMIEFTVKEQVGTLMEIGKEIYHSAIVFDKFMFRYHGEWSNGRINGRGEFFACTVA
jgi:hypothetical protein